MMWYIRYSVTFVAEFWETWPHADHSHPLHLCFNRKKWDDWMQE